ncbi:glycoside hydrolase family 28 protein [Edaphobacter dinghuensis]|uniref:Endopolygalacturonase n=1 Tax=Edaphobacter dinghuensis TaxID=1560005 RepID=A0A917H3I3_9BACT|nr:glycosyl hydrolase family 28 protein [Edaphobacter dinghuensis]GGG65833.1 endopolygalacturonase [Edaphobacter dinghuensis]
MNDDVRIPTNSKQMTRRQWLGAVPVPAMAAIAGAGLLTERAAAQPGIVKNTGDDLGTRIYNVRSFGAKGDGTTLDTAAVQAAIDACNKDGGGTVLVPAGTFLIGTVELRSHVTLHIAAAGKLLGSTNGKDYHAVDAIPLKGDSTLEDGNWALLFAVNAAHVSIEGPGTIDGQGTAFHSKVHGTPPPSGLGGDFRPYHVLVYRCDDFAVRNISLLDGAYHSIRVIQSKRVQMDGIYIHNRVNGNNDGFHFISAEYVTVSNCTIKSQDDACAMFGSCRFITITNSSFSTRWSVFRFGGGTAENITVSNCLLYEVDGCPIKLHAAPGTRLENISFSNLILQEVTGPINISVGPGEPKPGAAAQTGGGEQGALSREKLPAIVRNISFSNIHGTVTTNPPQLSEASVTSGFRPGEGHSCITLNCVAGSTLENISFDDVHLTFGGGGTAEEAARRDLPPYAGEYFALGPMPAYGFYARNAKGITLSNVRLQVATPDLRPALVLDHVEDAAVNGFSVQGNTEAESVLRFIDTSQVLITAARVLTPSSPFLQLEGTANESIILDGGDLSRAAKAVTYHNGATSKAIKVRE